jgi:hypothetical protein
MVDILSVLVEEMEVTVWSHRVVVVEAQSRSRGWGELRYVPLDMVTLTVGSERLILPLVVAISGTCHVS